MYILVSMLLGVSCTVVFLMAILQKGKVPRKDAKTWMERFSDAFWGMG